MTYSLALFPVGLVVGMGLVLLHSFALAYPGISITWLKAFPRSMVAGQVLLAVAALWALWLVRTMDLGEFSALRNLMTIGLIISVALTWKFVQEFLSIRALAILALLAAELLLCACFLQPQISRLFLVFLAYVWILGALFWIGLPWLLRDQIEWLVAKPIRFKIAALSGLVYGLLILASAFLFYR